MVNKPMKLRSKIILFTLPIWIISIIVMQFISSYYVKKETSKNLEKELVNTTLFVSERVDSLLDNASVDLQMCGVLPIFKEFLDYQLYGLKEESNLKKKEIKNIFKTLLKKRPAYLRMAFYSNQGNTIVSTYSPLHRQLSDFDDTHSRSDKVFEYKDTNVHFSEVYFDNVHGEQTIRLFYQQIDGSYTRGSIVLDISLNALFNSLNSLRLFSDSGIYILNHDNDLMYNTPSFGKTSLSDNAQKDFLKSQIVSIPSVNWQIGLLTPKKNASMLDYEIKKNIYLFAVIMILLIMPISVILSIFLSRPAEKIISLIKLKAEGRLGEVKFASRLKKSGYEFENIASALDKMISNIDNYYSKMKRMEALAAIGETTAMIAHDIRKPFANMKLFLMLFPEKCEDKEFIQTCLKGIEGSLVAADSMINDILDYSREAKLEINEHNIQSLLLVSIGEVLRTNGGSNIAIEYSLDHKNYICADAAKMQRVFANIIDNAIGAMKGNGKIFIETIDVDKNGQLFQKVVIGNSGPKIPDDVLPHLFEAFYTKGKKGGTGLGLAICHKVVMAHSGTIDVISKDERTDFVLEMPAKKGNFEIKTADLIYHSSEIQRLEPIKAAMPVVSDNEQVKQFFQLHKKRGNESYLLLVDDEPLFRESIRSMTNKIPEIRDNLKIIEVDSAELALKQFEQRKFDYVISDIDMGRYAMDGYEFVDAILEKYEGTCAIIHSNKRIHNKDLKVIGMKGFMGFLPKPMNSDELLHFLAGKSFDARKEGVYLLDTGTTSSEQKRKVLLLNDDDDFNISMKFILKSDNIQVIAANNVSDALSKFAQKGADVILSDINLGSGEKDGYEFLKEVRNKDAKIPFYFVSGFSESDVWPKAKPMGATGYLQIPVEKETLLNLLKNT